MKMLRVLRNQKKQGGKGLADMHIVDKIDEMYLQNVGMKMRLTVP